MPETLLRTKLFVPPLRASLVPRPRLIKRLNQGLQLGHKLFLISAPAGFGKTTLVSEWVDNLLLVTAKESQIENRIAWLSLDEDDNDPVRFLTYFITALNQIKDLQTDIGEGMLDMLRSPQPPSTKVILISLINEVAEIPERIILVLDDYHSIDSAQVDDALNFLLEYLPPQMHLVISTRNDPNLQIPRLHGRGQLTELRAADLRFSASEAAEFLNQVMSLDLSAKDVSALETRTEGWIAGLQLAAISMQGQKDAASLIKSFTGSHRLVLDYLIEEVLDQLSENIQEFLLQTSILDQLTGSLCDALTGQENSQATLEILGRANLFIIPLDEERCWYRYHHLFAELLRQRLNQTRPEQVPMLHQRASEWCEREGFPDRAIEHSLRSENFEKSAMLITEQANVTWRQGRQIQLFRWLERLPKEILHSKPQLCIYTAWYQYINGQYDSAEQSLLAAENAFRENKESSTETTLMEDSTRTELDWMKIRGRAATIRAELAFYKGEFQEIQKYAKLALEYLPVEDLPWRSAATAALGDAYGFLGKFEEAYPARLDAVQLSEVSHNHYIRQISVMKVVITLRQQGKLQQAIEVLQQELQLANKSGMAQTDVFGCILAIWGEILTEFYDLEEAIELARKGTVLAERGSDVGLIGWSYLCLMRVLFSKRDFSEFDEVYQRLEEINKELGIPSWITGQTAALQVRKWLIQGNWALLSHWQEENGLSIDDDELSAMLIIKYIVLARLLIAQKRLDDASRLLERLVISIDAGGWITRKIEVLILLSFLFQARNDTEGALATLEEAITLAEPRGFLGIFVDEGPPMACMLHEALSRGISPDYVSQLLRAFPLDVSGKAVSTESKIGQSELIEPLSEREIEVLQFIAEGLTNQEISTKLFLSLNTVKTHTRNIYAKLGAHSRMQAVARGRALGLILSV